MLSLLREGIIILTSRIAYVRILAFAALIIVILGLFIRPFRKLCTISVGNLFYYCILSLLIEMESSLYFSDEILALLCKGLLVVLNLMKV